MSASVRTPRRSLRVLVASLVLGALFAGAYPLGAPTVAAQAAAGPFLVGAATASADPTEPVCLGGYGSFCTRPMQGIKDPLTSRGLAITGGNGDTAIIVTSTAVGLFAAYKPQQGPNGIYDIRQRIAARIPVPAPNIVVVSDHSHAAPDTIGIWGGVDEAYMTRLARSIEDAAVDAYRARQPANLSVAAVEGPPLDASYDNGPTDNAAMDGEFRVLFADAPSGSRIATFVNYAPHATVCEKCDDHASGDWTAWAAQEIEQAHGGIGFGAVGALGATDWNKTGDSVAEREGEARERIRRLLAEATTAKVPVRGTDVGVEMVFVREQLAQPVLLANYLPGIPGGGVEPGEIRIDRATTPPWLTGTALGTYFGVIRVGDVFMSTFPGEPFPQLQRALRDEGGVAGAQAHFLLGAANDFLGYMVNDDEQYRQTAEEGATFLEGCQEQKALEAAGVPHDGACPDHWTLMVSPTIGRHGVCTIQDAAERLGFATGPRDELCAALTASDGAAAPAEHPGLDTSPQNVSRAGVASVDATWHVGASGGQFTEDGPPMEDAVDPHGHSVKKRISDGVGTRVFTRALVTEDTEGDRVAVVQTDLYLPQDFLTRRVASLLEEHDRNVALGVTQGPITAITDDNLATTASHNHNTPYYSTPSWGVWVFQDVYDLRFYDYMAQQMAQAVIDASADLRPVRMAGTTVAFNEITSHTYGPQHADDGTPAGQPYDYTTQQLSVVRFDDISDPASPRPYANWVVFGVHPEYTWGDDLINGDVTHSAMRMVDREHGTTTVMSQRETGTSGPHKDTRVHAPQERREFQDMGLDAADRAARLLATRIGDALDDIAGGTPEDPTRFAPYSTDFDIEVASERFVPPATRPYPGVSNCNTRALFHGDPRLPILGLPDCKGVDSAGEIEPVWGAAPVRPGDAEPHTAPFYEQLKNLGVPIPESYSATALTGVEETAAVHLMALKLGTIGVTFCPCEQFTSQALNIESRLNEMSGDLFDGFDWADQTTPTGRDWCIQHANTSWTCADPKNPAVDLAPVSDEAYLRMRAQIHNDAAGWETDLATLGSEAEPDDPALIKGNFTQEEFPQHGYDLVLSVGMANDYWGYVPEYREYRAHDHYRKALSGLGPHGADYLATRLSRMAASLNGAPAVALSPLDLAYQAESARSDVVANGLGELARAYETVYRQTLPADGGDPAIVAQPRAIERFDGAHVEFIGGSNYVDTPNVRVERLVSGVWRPYGDDTGEAPVMVRYPTFEQLPDWRAGEFEWHWTASFEAFASDITQPDASGAPRRATLPGTYRFVIDGRHREVTGERAYHLESAPFTVGVWTGITASDLRVEPGGRVSFAVGPVNTYTYGTPRQYVVGPIDYPDRYTSPFRYLSPSGGPEDAKNVGRRLYTYGASDPSVHQQYCRHCTFEPWADTGTVASASMQFIEGTSRSTVSATFDPATGRWVTTRALTIGGRAFVPARVIEDAVGNVNGARSVATVTRSL